MMKSIKQLMLMLIVGFGVAQAAQPGDITLTNKTGYQLLVSRYGRESILGLDGSITFSRGLPFSISPYYESSVGYFLNKSALFWCGCLMNKIDEDNISPDYTNYNIVLKDGKLALERQWTVLEVVAGAVTGAVVGRKALGWVANLCGGGPADSGSTAPTEIPYDDPSDAKEE